MTYQIYLDTGGDKLFPEVKKLRGKTAVRCKCGQTAYPYDLIDVRKIPKGLTGGEKFVCSGCYSTWEREKRQIDTTDDFLIPEEFSAKFIEIKTGQKDAGAESVRLAGLRKEKTRIMEDESRYVLAPDDHPDKVKLKSRRVKLENRIKKG